MENESKRNGEKDGNINGDVALIRMSQWVWQAEEEEEEVGVSKKKQTQKMTNSVRFRDQSKEDETMKKQDANYSAETTNRRANKVTLESTFVFQSAVMNAYRRNRTRRLTRTQGCRCGSWVAIFWKWSESDTHRVDQESSPSRLCRSAPREPLVFPALKVTRHFEG